MQIESFVPETKLYSDLVDFEKKLDATIMRKRLDIQEALGKPTKVSARENVDYILNKCCQVRRTLRIFVSNTASTPSANAEDENAFDLNSGNAPLWTLKLEGQLLEVKTKSTVTYKMLKVNIVFNAQ